MALGVKKCLNPIWLKSGNDQCEALTVQISMENLDIRITNAYGPQNYDDGHKKVEFWAYLENEVNISNQSNVGCIIMFDANSWLGYYFLCSDPNPQNENGKIFEDFLERNKNMTLLNSHPSCQGFITRSRIVKNKEERSIIDFILICDKILPYFQKMFIYEEKTWALTNFRGKEAKRPAVKSDHNVLKANFRIKYKRIKIQSRKTIFNFNDKGGMKIFNWLSSQKGRFTKHFSNSNDF